MSKIQVVGITGTNGKTTTTYLVQQAELHLLVVLHLLLIWQLVELPLVHLTMLALL